jgi:hypothetical protein
LPLLPRKRCAKVPGPLVALSRRVTIRRFNCPAKRMSKQLTKTPRSC